MARKLPADKIRELINSWVEGWTAFSGAFERWREPRLDLDKIWSRRQEPREYELIRQEAAAEWPDGYERISTRIIIKRVGDRFKHKGLPVPKRDVFLRALDRR